MRTMLLGQFDETRYYRTIIDEDVDKTLYSLREKYKENNKDISDNYLFDYRYNQGSRGDTPKIY